MTVREVKEAGVACKTAKDAASRATAAKAAAWARRLGRHAKLTQSKTKHAKKRSQAHHAAAAVEKGEAGTLFDS